MYLSDATYEIRNLLNDSISPYRFSNELLLQTANQAVREIHRLRPDSLISGTGTVDRLTGLYSYTASSYMSEYDNINGWDRYTYPTLYATMYTGTTVVRLYTSSADRAGDTNEVAEITRCDSAGVKPVRELNSSGFCGTVKMLTTPANGTDWDIEANEQQIPLDDIFMKPFVNYIVHRCFSIDSEDQADANLSQKYLAEFLSELKG